MSRFFRKPVQMYSSCLRLRRSLSAEDMRDLVFNTNGKVAEVHSDSETASNEKATCARLRSKISLKSSSEEDRLEICDIFPEPFGLPESEPPGPSEPGLKETKQKAKARSKPARGQPNYFIAFRVKNQTILERLEAVQECAREKVKLPKSSLVSLKKAHITLAVLRLDEVHCLHDARSALHAAVKEMTEKEFSLNLEFQGLGSFSGHVLYARVIKNDSFAKLLWIRECLVKSFRDVGITLSDDNFSPHLTVAKLTYVSKKEAKKRLKIKLEDFDDMSDTHFGTEIVESIQLLKMKSIEEDGFYVCAEEIPLRSFSCDTIMECD